MTPEWDGCRVHRICEPPEARAERVRQARTEVATALHVPLAEVGVLTSPHDATHELIRGQWLPAWRR